MKKGTQMSPRLFNNESGIAMVVVLFAAAVLTVVASTAAFVAINEFKSAGSDQRGSQALSYAEAGIDRMMLDVRGSRWTWGQVVQSGCDDEDGNGDVADDDADDLQIGSAGAGANDDLVFLEGTVGTGGSYRVELRHPGCPNPIPSPREPQRVQILSDGQHPTARRVVQQIIEVAPRGLPVALFATSGVSAAGGVGSETETQRISLITEGNVDNRDNIGFVGLDPWYSVNDFYGSGSSSTKVPAAAHAVGDLFCNKKSSCSNEAREHFGNDPDLNCKANPRGDAGQSGWDGSALGGSTSALSACSGWTTKPPTSKFDAAMVNELVPNPALEDDDLRALYARAKSSGLYCNYRVASPYCTMPDPADEDALIQVGAPSVFTKNWLNQSGLKNNWIAYFEFEPGSNPKAAANTIDWRAPVGPLCGGAQESTVLMIPDGSITFRGAGGGGGESVVAGAIFAEKGVVDVASGIKIHGTVIADQLRMQAGSTFLLDECWLDNMPFTHLRVIPIAWSEVDR
jgi:hypothetical protein